MCVVIIIYSTCEIDCLVYIGHTSKFETRIAVDSDGNPCAVSKCGQLSEAMPSTTMKYAGEARGCFGVCMVKTGVDKYEGKKADIFDYTGQLIVGPAKYGKAKEAELRRVKDLGGIRGPKGR